MTREPKRLRLGKTFHRIVQKNWISNAQGEVEIEKATVKPNGRKGRIDVIVDATEDIVAIVELKRSDWDAMAEKNVRRNVRRQIQQILSYVEPYLETDKAVCAGVAFPKRPQTPGRLKMIEALFLEEGISVVWEDELIPRR